MHLNTLLVDTCIRKDDEAAGHTLETGCGGYWFGCFYFRELQESDRRGCVTLGALNRETELSPWLRGPFPAGRPTPGLPHLLSPSTASDQSQLQDYRLVKNSQPVLAFIFSK